MKKKVNYRFKLIINFIFLTLLTSCSTSREAEKLKVEFTIIVDGKNIILEDQKELTFTPKQIEGIRLYARIKRLCSNEMFVFSHFSQGCLDQIPIADEPVEQPFMPLGFTRRGMLSFDLLNNRHYSLYTEAYFFDPVDEDEDFDYSSLNNRSYKVQLDFHVLYNEVGDEKIYYKNFVKEFTVHIKE